MAATLLLVLVAAAPVVPGQPAGLVLVETVTIPVDGSSVSSTAVLDAGVTYTLRASGTFTIGGPGFGDAEYAFNSDESWVIDNCFDSPSGVDIGIGIDDTVNDASKVPDWGPYTSTHEYTVELVGSGAPIGLNYHDCGYGDNSGSLTVEFLAPATPAPEPARLSLTDGVLHTVGEPGYRQAGLARLPERFALTAEPAGPPGAYGLAAPEYGASPGVEIGPRSDAVWWLDGATPEAVVDEAGPWSVHLSGSWRTGCLSATLGTAVGGIFRAVTPDRSALFVPTPGGTLKLSPSTMPIGPRQHVALHVRNACAQPAALDTGSDRGGEPVSWIERGVRVPASVATDPWVVHELARGSEVGNAPVRIGPLADHVWVLSDAPVRVSTDLGGAWTVHLTGTWAGPCFFAELGAMRGNGFVAGAADGTTRLVPLSGHGVPVAASELLLEEDDLLAMRLANRCVEGAVVETRGTAGDPTTSASWIEAGDGSMLPTPVPEGPSALLLGAGLVLISSLAALGWLRARGRTDHDHER